MDSNTFAPSGQGPDNNMTPQASPNPPTPPVPPTPPQPVTPPTPTIPPAPVAPEPTPAPTQIPVSSPEPTPAPTPISAPEPVSMPTLEPTPALSPADATPTPTTPAKNSNSKLFIIIGSCLIGLALIIVLLFVIPFGGSTLWQKLTGGSDSNGIKTGDTVTTAGYTYTANLDLEYEPSGDFSDGLLRARGSNGNTVFLNNAGQLALTLGDEYTIANYDGNFHEGLLAVGCDDLYYSNPYSLEANDDFGYLDKTGELAIPCQFASAGDFSNGYAVVSTVVSDDEPTAFDSVSGYYDDDGNYIEETIVDYYDNVIQKYGVIDTSGNFVVEYQDYDIDESSTFENGVYKASDPDTYIQYCFTIQGENLGEANYYNSNSCYAEDTSSDAVAARESIQESLGDQYTVKDFNDGVALVISKESMGSAYFVDLQGNKVFDLMSVNLVEVRSYEYSEGLFMAYVWDGSDPYPGFEAMISGDDDTEEFANSVFNNTSIVYFDAKGQIVFRYHFADHYDSMEQYQAMNTYNSD